MTRYPMEINATTLVYLRESRRRRNARGMTTSLWELAMSKVNEMAAIHENCYPEVSVDKKWYSISVLIEASDDSRH